MPNTRSTRRRRAREPRTARLAPEETDEELYREAKRRSRLLVDCRRGAAGNYITLHAGIYTQDVISHRQGRTDWREISTNARMVRIPRRWSDRIRLPDDGAV